MFLSILHYNFTTLTKFNLNNSETDWKDSLYRKLTKRVFLVNSNIHNKINNIYHEIKAQSDLWVRHFSYFFIFVFFLLCMSVISAIYRTKSSKMFLHRNKNSYQSISKGTSTGLLKWFLWIAFSNCKTHNLSYFVKIKIGSIVYTRLLLSYLISYPVSTFVICDVIWCEDCGS